MKEYLGHLDGEIKALDLLLTSYQWYDSERRTSSIATEIATVAPCPSSAKCCSWRTVAR